MFRPTPRADHVAAAAPYVLVARSALEVVGGRIEMELSPADTEVAAAVGAGTRLASGVDVDLNGLDLRHLKSLPRGGGPVSRHRRRTR
jgi:hypothetical protein